jgi:hypothetical protein
MARCGATETCSDEAYLGGLCKFHHDIDWFRSRGGYRITAARARWPRVACTKCSGTGMGSGPGNRCVLCHGDGYRVPDGATLVRAYRPKDCLRSANDWASRGPAVLYEKFGYGEKTYPRAATVPDGSSVTSPMHPIDRHAAPGCRAMAGHG